MIGRTEIQQHEQMMNFVIKNRIPGHYFQFLPKRFDIYFSVRLYNTFCWSLTCDGLPGIKWKPDEHGVIAFDCRNRKWYIQAATSPKDVVILVDVSGSMKGLRLTIARQTVSSILDTLGDDDFFNIIAVSPHRCVHKCNKGA